jgi:REP-associated tyrosine transposase
VPRPPRDEAVDALHHVVAQGNGRRTFVADDLDRIDFLRRLAAACATHTWTCSAYCLLDTHAHLIVKTTIPNLGRGMQRLLGDYARAFNSRHSRNGHVFRRPYYSRRIVEEQHLYATMLYVVLNPVVAGLCAHPAEWTWCSYRQTAFDEPGFVAPESALTCFGSDVLRARAAYRTAVEDAVERAHPL